MNCLYCHQDTESGATNKDNPSTIHHCKKCRSFFNYDYGILSITIIFFNAGDRYYRCKMDHLENRSEVRCSDTWELLMQAPVIPDWNPSNISEKFSDYLVFL